jgi:hypothetical protein
MSIRIRNLFDPLSPHSLDPLDSTGADTVEGASCAAARVFRQELERYCEGQLSGCSFLIAGHRGSGKTTMVEAALDSMIRKSLSGEPGRPALPLPVFLNGPSLFATSGQADSRRASSRLRDKADDTDPAKEALVQVILGLHRAVVQQYVEAYRKSVLELSRRYDSVDYAELAAQFEVEILEDPHASRLREFWDVPGRLNVGVLFPNSSDFTQGMRELVALNGVCNAHQRISGEIKSTDKTGQDASTETRSSTSTETKLVDLVKPLASLVAGASVATGGAIGTHDVVLPALAGIVTALGASTLFKTSVTRSHKRERHLDTVFMPDLSLKTLDRVLPMLLLRLRNAGLAPVLVIDELDKVPDLEEKLVEIISFLKKLIAEGAFTCFLTDREYYERLNAAGRHVAYGLESSYYTHRLLIAFQPGDFDEYLGRLLEVDEGVALAGTPDPRYLADSDVLDKKVWQWVLRHRSELHALELAREVASIRREDGLLDLPQGYIRSDSAAKVGVTLQFALELAMKDLNLVTLERQKPELMQTIHDALYYPTRKWLAEEELDLEGERAKEAFRVYLDERICSRRNGAKPVAHEERRQRAAVAADLAGQTLKQSDLDRLFNLVQRMSWYLGEKFTREDARKHWAKACREMGEGEGKLGGEIEDMLLLGEDSLLYVEPQDPSRTRHWRYNASGASRRAGGISLQRAYRLSHVIQGREKDLAACFGSHDVPVFQRLADHLRILPTSPAWPRVASAMDSVGMAYDARFEVGGPLSEDVRQVASFWRLLGAYAGPLAHAIYLGAALGGLAPGSDVGERGRVYRGLEVLTYGHDFSAINTVEKLREALDDVSRQFHAVVQRHSTVDHYLRESSVARAFERRALDSVLDGALALSSALRPVLKSDPQITLDAWKSLLFTVNAVEHDQPPVGASVALMICMLQGTGPGKYNLGELGKGYPGGWDCPAAWGSLLMLEMREPVREQTPRWFWLWILNRLGARSLERGLRRSLMNWMSGLLAPGEGGPPEFEEAAREFAEAGNGTATRVAVLVSRASDSVSGRWSGAPGAGWLLVVKEDDLKPLAARHANDSRFLPDFPHSRSARGLSEEARALIALVASFGFPVRVALEQPLSVFDEKDYEGIIKSIENEPVLFGYEGEQEFRSQLAASPGWRSKGQVFRLLRPEDILTWEPPEAPRAVNTAGEGIPRGPGPMPA